MAVISFVNQKGGVGKTTLAFNVSSHLASLGCRVLAIDADPQASLMQWAARRAELGVPEEFKALAYTDGPLHRDVVPYLSQYDYVVIDAPGIAAAITPACVVAADLCVIPVRPNPLDVWSAHPVITMIKDAQALKPIQAAFVVNQNKRTKISTQVTEAVGQLAFPLVRFSVADRTAFTASVSAGMAVGEYEPAGAAAAEIAAVTHHLLTLLPRRPD